MDSVNTFLSWNMVLVPCFFLFFFLLACKAQIKCMPLKVPVPHLFVPLQYPLCSRCVWSSVCSQSPSPSQQIPHQREVLIFPSIPPRWCAVFLAQQDRRDTQELLDPQGPWALWVCQGWMVQMEKTAKREKREMEVVLSNCGYFFVNLATQN